MGKPFLFRCLFFGALLIVGIFFYDNRGFAQSTFVDTVDAVDPVWEDFLAQEYVSRYDMAKYINMVSCQDCVHPPEEMMEKYDRSWLEATKQEANYALDDLELADVYYYCVAEVAEQGYMYGFPRNTSPYCPGKFCGESTARFTEVVESLYRLVRSQVYDDYSINWTEVSEWLVASNSALPVSWTPLITAGVESCGDELCELKSTRELDIMMYYCSSNITDCNLASYSAFPQGKRPSALLSLLVREDIISPEEANTMTLHDFITPEQLVRYLAPVYAYQDCVFDLDYDGDRIENSVDICPYSYDPAQYDADGDGLGNVCDGDIDNDGHTNPVGLVDDQNTINPRLWKDNEDSCPLLANIDQANEDGDVWGDVCDPDNEESMMALWIDATPRVGVAPLTIGLTQDYVGSLDTLLWHFGDGTRVEGLSPQYSYFIPGDYVVTATAMFEQEQKIVAKLPVEVLPNPDAQVACAGNVSAFVVPVGGTVDLLHVFSGPLQKVVRIVDGETIAVDPGQGAQVRFDTAGRQRIEMQCYNTDGERVGLGQFTITVTDEAEGYGAVLEASAIVVEQGDLIDFSTSYDGFSPAEVQRVIWDFGDTVITPSQGLTIEKVYTDHGVYVVKETILFSDGRDPVDNVLTIVVQATEQGASTTLVGEPLVGNAGDIFSFDLTLEDIAQEEMSQLVRDCDEEGEERFTDDITSYVDHTCTYRTPGSKRVKSYVYTLDGDIYINEMSIYVLGTDLCLEDPEAYRCDLDGDELPDLCDDDIDGDGVLNCLHLLRFEQESCAIDNQNIDSERLAACHAAIGEGADFDNCPFVPNTDQLDTDADTYGDVCDPVPEGEEPELGTGAGDGGGGGGGGGGDGSSNGDSDGDGIDDGSDACGGVPESNNGSEGGDGCPELPEKDDEKKGDNPFVEAKKCTSCPCPYADYGSALWKGDRVRALLLDEAGEIIYRYTKPEIIMEDIPDQLKGG